MTNRARIRADSAPRIGIDGYNLALPNGTGVATYARSLAATIRELGFPLDLIYGVDVGGSAAPEARQTMFFQALGRIGDPTFAPKPAARRRRQALLHPFAYELTPVERDLRVIDRDFADRVPACDRLLSRPHLFEDASAHFRRYGRFMTVRLPEAPAIMHWTYPLPIRLAGAINIYTIYDLIPIRLPHLSRENKAYHERLLRACVSAADHIVTVSETSRRDLIDFAACPPGRVTNCYLPIAPSATGDTPEGLKGLFDVDHRRFLLFFGSIEPKKNVSRIIEAYLAADIALPLLIVGKDVPGGEGETRLLDQASGLPGARRIRRIPYLPRRLLDRLVGSARAVIFPSLAEGFGLPALEAMARGTPVLASTAGSLPEVVADAALCVDPYDVDAIGAGMARLATDDTLWAHLSEAGRERSFAFSPHRYSAAIGALYAQLIADADRA